MMKKMVTSVLGLAFSVSSMAADCKVTVTNLDSILSGRDSLRIDLVRILAKKGFELTRGNESKSFVIKIGTLTTPGYNVNAFLKAGDLLKTSPITSSHMQSAYNCNNLFFPCVRHNEIGKEISGSYILYKKDGEFTDPYDHVPMNEFSYKYADKNADTELIKKMIQAIPNCKKL